MASSGYGLDLVSRPILVVVNDRKEYEVDYILCACGWGSRNSEDQRMLWNKLQSALYVLSDWENHQES